MGNTRQTWVRRREKVDPEQAATKDKQAGFAFLDVTIAGMVLGITFLSMANLMTSNVKTTNQVQALDRATVLLEETLDSLGAQPYDNVLAMNGNRFFSASGTTTSAGTSTQATDSTSVGAGVSASASQGQAGFRVELAVTETAPNLLTVRAILIDQKTGRELSRVLTHRSRR